MVGAARPGQVEEKMNLLQLIKRRPVVNIHQTAKLISTAVNEGKYEVTTQWADLPDGTSAIRAKVTTVRGTAIAHAPVTEKNPELAAVYLALTLLGYSCNQDSMFHVSIKKPEQIPAGEVNTEETAKPGDGKKAKRERKVSVTKSKSEEEQAVVN